MLFNRLKRLPSLRINGKETGAVFSIDVHVVHE